MLRAQSSTTIHEVDLHNWIISKLSERHFCQDVTAVGGDNTPPMPSTISEPSRSCRSLKGRPHAESIVKTMIGHVCRETASGRNGELLFAWRIRLPTDHHNGVR